MFSENKFSSIGPIYYEYGSMVITFDSSSTAVVAYEILKNRIFEDKKLLGEYTQITVVNKFLFLLDNCPKSAICCMQLSHRRRIKTEERRRSSLKVGGEN